MTVVRRNILLAAAAVAALGAAAWGVSPALGAPQAPDVGTTHMRTTGQKTVPQKTAAAALHGTGEAPVPAADLADPKYGTWGFDVSGMDTAIKPGDDFFGYANGKWAARTEIPADRTRFGNFDKLSVLSENRVHEIAIEAAAGKLKDKDGAKIGAAYAAFMNEALANKLGAQPIQPELGKLKAVTTKAQLTGLMAKANATGFTTVFPVGIGADAKSPNKYAVHAANGGLGLPDRDYYLQASFAEKKAKYQAYVQQLLTLSGWPKPAENAKAVVDFETKLAEASWTRVERRDRDKTYNPMSPAELDTLAPGIGWTKYLADADLPGVQRVIVSTNTAFPKVAKIYADTPLDTLKAWEAFHVADGAAPYLSRAFVDASYEFRSKELAGQPEQQPRWKRAVAFTNGVIGESVGRVYVARYFPPAAKAKMDALVGDIQTALHARIEKLPWMGDATRAKALEKLSKFTVKIGYPNKWRDYSKLVLTPTDLYGDVQRSGAFEWHREVARLNGPVDKAEWGMTPQTVNAYYNSSNNEIVFPAAILAPPFFDPDADPAINYGAIGGVIGHETSHGFDDQGRKSNGDGVLTDWWTPDDATKFKAQTDRLDAQYSAFSPLPGEHVIGQLTMGENIGDMGGLSLALDAYHASLHGKPAPVIDGLTGDQRVFLGWAQVWREKIRDETLRQRLHTDPHSPALYRVNGTIRNIDGWYSAFDVKPGDKLYVAPDQRVRIW
ncbi:M13-type metalloendopeptidase [Phenylobacterium sp.]|uniref:M13 family metallopeptidase n=1 Tax=Phenylobacterium sp. TaxID=1871053 RepID=UPI001200165A|nr:M13-type metalloendopeptidase [Phenylobacterium sp.]THD64712.1 MAG: peptidase M13 [Phenylobacterium sp.]